MKKKFVERIQRKYLFLRNSFACTIVVSIHLFLYLGVANLLAIGFLMDEMTTVYIAEAIRQVSILECN